MKPRMIEFYMGIAEDCAEMSRAVKMKVGAVVVKDDNIISFSWNGTPTGWDNVCEHREYAIGGGWLSPEEILSQYPYKDDETGNYYKLVTKPEVIHAERNALDKLARTVNSGQGAYLFCTHAPCIECAKSIYGAGIVKVFYRNEYRCNKGIKFLEECNIDTFKVPR
jgi:dCMP deaminase